MRFGPVPLTDALGAVLAHSMKLPDGTLKKGVVLTSADLQRLAKAGTPTVVTARLDTDDVPEDGAAQRVAQALAGAGVEIGAAVTGRVNLYALGAGLMLLDAARIHAANRVHEGLTIATLHPDTPVGDGQMLATVKIIPYAVPVAALAEVVRVLSSPDAVQVALWKGLRVGLVLTQTATTAASVRAKMRRAVLDRLTPLAATLV
ncbi:MAG: 4-diphosphocytidyl-2C-methyl-D-erythritol kinase, partial [Steroidobacteraceae bacterium]